MTDYIVVGLGLAGIACCEALEAQGQSFIVFADSSQKASQVAGGLYNPVILKRCTLAWKGPEQLALAKPFYKHLAQKLNVSLDHPHPILRRFASVAEQNTWFEAAARPGLEPFLSPTLVPNTNPALYAPYGFGLVQHTGRIDTQTLLAAYKAYLTRQKRLVTASFNFANLTLHTDFVQYHTHKARRLIFAEGYGLANNPYFNYLPLNGTKGELLTIEAPDLNEHRILKAAVFIIPLGHHHYRVGATYAWDDPTHRPTTAAKKQLLHKLQSFLQCPFKVVDHTAGIRPTVADRRPLVGQHPVYKNLYTLNGLGSRGVLTAPYAARQLLNAIHQGTPLEPEIDLRRFAHHYPS